MADQVPTRRARPERPAVKDKGKRKKPLGRRLLVWVFFIAVLGIVCGIIGYLLIILNGERILAANQDKFVMEEASTIYDINKKEVAKLSRINRDSVDLTQVPELLQNAFIATEDRRFREHAGVDIWAVGRALARDVVARHAVEGGSTITQQLAKNIFLTHDKTFFRKASEASIAVALENKMTKDQILEMYLNRIFFGQRAYGIKAASEVYFGVSDLNKLKLWQMATLAGLPKAPSTYNPISNPEKSRDRMAIVLQLMVDQKYITADQMAEAKAEALNYKPPTPEKDSADSYTAYTDYVIAEAEKVTGLTEEQLRLGGYNIYTSLNTKAQSIMQKQFDDADNFEKSPDDEIEQGAMIIIDHRTGEIEAMVGGRDYETKGLNRVYQDPRQPGSSFKPIAVYGPALETGKWFPWSILRDDKTCYGDYCPSDSNSNKFIGPIPMTQSVKESRNASAIWLLNEIGVDTGVAFANKLGFDLGKDDRNLAVGLGGLTHGVTPMQMATAYSVFANGGKSVDPHAIAEIDKKDGTVVYTYNAPRAKQLIKPETAWYLTQVMEGVVEKGGTGAKAAINRPVAGKTGTTQHGIKGLSSSYNRDAWFVGYTPEWTAAIWMGYPKVDKEHLLKRSSVQAAEMFAKVMEPALEGVPVTQFAKPKGVKNVVEPQAVGGLSAAYNDANAAVVLAWNPVSGDNVTYRVYRKESTEGSFSLLGESQGAPTMEDRTVMPGLAYEYYVTTYDPDSGTEGKSSSHVGVTIPNIVLDPSPGAPMDDPGDLPDTDGGTVVPDPNNPGTGTDDGTGGVDNGTGGTGGATDGGTGTDGGTDGAGGATDGTGGTGGTGQDNGAGGTTDGGAAGGDTGANGGGGTDAGTGTGGTSGGAAGGTGAGGTDAGTDGGRVRTESAGAATPLPSASPAPTPTSTSGGKLKASSVDADAPPDGGTPAPDGTAAPAQNDGAATAPPPAEGADNADAGTGG